MGDLNAWLSGWQPMHWLAFAVFCCSLAISGGLDSIARAIRDRPAATPKGGA